MVLDVNIFDMQISCCRPKFDQQLNINMIAGLPFRMVSFEFYTHEQAVQELRQST